MLKFARTAPAVSALVLFYASQAVAQGDPEAGRIKAETCLGCHGIPSYQVPYPTYHVPKIGGQHADYIVNALNAYKNGDRQFPTMNAQASSLSEQDIEDIAAFFSQRKSSAE